MLDNKYQPCLKYQVKGFCFSDCKFKDTHHKLECKVLTITDNYIKKLQIRETRRGLSGALPFPRIPPDNIRYDHKKEGKQDRMNSKMHDINTGRYEDTRSKIETPHSYQIPMSIAG